MTSSPFSKAHFVLSTLDEKDYPNLVDRYNQPLPEIVMVGKSNVGKSSLINHLLELKSLAKISTKPGKTQTINFFNLNNQLCLVDLPGYGYAKVPKKLKKDWSIAIDHYLNTRERIKLALLLLDPVKDPSSEDLQFVEWALHKNIPLLIILTKCDKIKSNQLNSRSKFLHNLLKEDYGVEDPEIVNYSIKDHKCRNLLRKTLLNLLP